MPARTLSSAMNRSTEMSPEGGGGGVRGGGGEKGAGGVGGIGG